MLLIHESIPVMEISLQTELQAVAASVNINRSITVASVYFSAAHEFFYNILLQLINQLPKPFILLGDFNSYHQMWGCNTTRTIGRIIEKLITDKSLNILNTGAPTRIRGNSETAIDLSICSPILKPTIEWTPLETTRDRILPNYTDDDKCTDQPGENGNKLSQNRFEGFQRQRWVATVAGKLRRNDRT